MDGFLRTQVLLPPPPPSRWTYVNFSWSDAHHIICLQNIKTRCFLISICQTNPESEVTFKEKHRLFLGFVWYIKVALGVSQQFFYEREYWNIISMLKLSNFSNKALNKIMFLPLFGWSSFSLSAPLLGSRVVYIFCLHNKVRVLSNIYSHFCSFQSLWYLLFW